MASLEMRFQHMQQGLDEVHGDLEEVHQEQVELTNVGDRITGKLISSTVALESRFDMYVSRLEDDFAYRHRPSAQLGR